MKKDEEGALIAMAPYKYASVTVGNFAPTYVTTECWSMLITRNKKKEEFSKKQTSRKTNTFSLKILKTKLVLINSLNKYKGYL